MEILTTMRATMPTKTDYYVMKRIIEKLIDETDIWPIEEYNDEELYIDFAEDYVMKEEAVDLAAELIERAIQSVINNETEEELVNNFRNLSYELDGTTNEGGYVEINFIIERKNGELYMKESYFSHEDYAYGYDESEESAAMDEDEYYEMMESKREEDYEKWWDEKEFEEVDIYKQIDNVGIGRLLKDLIHFETDEEDEKRLDNRGIEDLLFRLLNE